MIANFSPVMLQSNADHAGLTRFFDSLAAFGGWDAAGAKSFGHPTVWVNRFNQPPEELGVHPDRTVPDLAGLLDFVLATPAATTPGKP